MKLFQAIVLIALCAAMEIALCATPPVSLTGFSSGAYFAVQYQFAHSASVSGAAIFAGGPYYCAQGSETTALTACMSIPSEISLPALYSAAQSYAKSAAIDPLSNLQQHNVFLFSGSDDQTVNPGCMRALQQMYKNYKVNSSKSNFNLGDNHGFPTLTYGNDCSTSYPPYINDCNYDGAGQALQAILGPLKAAASPISSNLVTFQQQKFTPGKGSPDDISLASTGYAYIPSGCKPGSGCRVHVVFHGCQQYAGTVGTAFVANSGFNGWAEANNIIVLYPQTTTSFFDPSNPEGCWDWWGYNEAAYSTKKGSQVQFVYNLAQAYATR